MADLHGFEANHVEPTRDFEPIPAGKYHVVITESELKLNKAQTGSFLELTFEIQEGPHQGRLVWTRLNLDHPNPKAVEIARSELSSLCRAVGVLAPKDSVELHNLSLVITVKCRKREDNGELTNEIKGYAKKEAPVASPPPAAGNAPPWKRS